MKESNSIVQISLGILLTQYQELLLVDPNLSEHTHLNELSHIHVFYRFLTTGRKINFIRQLIFKIQMTHCFNSLCLCPGKSNHITLKWFNKSVTSMNVSTHTKVTFILQLILEIKLIQNNHTYLKLLLRVNCLSVCMTLFMPKSI